jgi:hypothetical protein
MFFQQFSKLININGMLNGRKKLGKFAVLCLLELVLLRLPELFLYLIFFFLVPFTFVYSLSNQSRANFIIMCELGQTR